MSEEKVYACEHPGCKMSGTAGHMWNFKGYPRVIVCGKHGFEARKRDIVTFKLSASLEHEQKIARAKAEARKVSEDFYSRGAKKSSYTLRVGTLGKAVGKDVVEKMRLVSR